MKPIARPLLASAILGSILTATNSGPAAAAIQCPIPAGSYRTSTWWGCAAVAYIGGYEGYVADLSSTPGCVVVERQISTSPVAWDQVGPADCTAGGEVAYISVPGAARSNLRMRSGNIVKALPAP